MTLRVMSKDVTQLIITALERDRELYCQLLSPLFQSSSIWKDRSSRKASRTNDAVARLD